MGHPVAGPIFFGAARILTDRQRGLRENLLYSRNVNPRGFTSMNAATDIIPAKPDHVPEALFWDHDFIEFAHELANPFEAICRLHDGPDIIYARNVSRRPAWIFTRYADQQEVFVNHENFSVWSEDPARRPFEFGGIRLNPNAYDPPQQRSYRRILEPRLTPSAVKKLEGEIRQLCRNLMKPLEGRKGCDFIGDFARFFPTTFFMNLVGMPLDRFEQFMEWERQFMQGAPNERESAVKNIIAFLEAHIEYLRAHPGDDLISLVIGSKIDGNPLCQDEIMGFCFLFYIAGLDTVLSSLGWHFRHVAGDHVLQTRMRDNPADSPKAVDEMLRAFGVSIQPRVVARDLVFKGIDMKKGDAVALPTCLAGRDPLQFENPHIIDIDRATPRHLTFGSGNHLCLGRNLARLEICIVFEEFLSHFKNIRLADAAPPLWHGSGVMGLDRLDLAWD